MTTINLIYNDNCYNDFVYDLETEDGTFQAGEGHLIVKNTDSIYTQFILSNEEKKKLTEDEYLQRIFEVSKECAKRISDTFKKPIELEMEKVMNPLYLFKKKQYVMLYKEKPTDKWEMDAKGIKIVRRDNCPYVKETSMSILNRLLYHKDISGAEKIARQKVEDLLTDKIPIESLVISKSLKSHYKTVNKSGHSLSKPPQAQLADRMKIRDPMNAPNAGDRVPYVFIQTKNKHDKQGDKSEDPTYVIKNKLKIDSLYYLEHQLKTAICSLLSVVVKDKYGNIFPDTKKGEKEAFREVENRIWKDLKIRKQCQMNGQTQISDFFKVKSEQELLCYSDSDEETVYE